MDDAGHITRVLLQKGHLWGRKEVEIPVASLERIDGYGVHVRLSKHEIADLPKPPAGRPQPVTMPAHTKEDGAETPSSMV